MLTVSHPFLASRAAAAAGRECWRKCSWLSTLFPAAPLPEDAARAACKRAAPPAPRGGTALLGSGPAARLAVHPVQADGRGVELSAPAAPAGTQLAAQFSITWRDVPPSMIGETHATAFKAAILKQLPAGAQG